MKILNKMKLEKIDFDKEDFLTLAQPGVLIERNPPYVSNLVLENENGTIVSINKCDQVIENSHFDPGKKSFDYTNALPTSHLSKRYTINGETMSAKEFGDLVFG